MLAPPSELGASARLDAHRRQMEDLNVPPEQIEAALADELPDPEFKPLPETAETLDLFSVVSSQWRMRQVPVGMGASISKPYGLDYAACEAIVRLRGLSFPPDTWANLQTLEQELTKNGNAGR